MARKKAATRGIEAEFATADAFHLDRQQRRFQTVLDCGLFHTFEDDERPQYVTSLASVTQSGGTLYVLCFSDEGPEPGPHPVPQPELRAAFSEDRGWNVLAVESERIETNFHANGVAAWLATIRRI